MLKIDTLVWKHKANNLQTHYVLLTVDVMSHILFFVQILSLPNLINTCFYDTVRYSWGFISALKCHIWTSEYIICQMLHYQLTVELCDVFLSLGLREVCSRVKRTTPAWHPDATISVFWPCGQKAVSTYFILLLTQYIFPLFLLDLSGGLPSLCVHSSDINPIQGVDGLFQPLNII